MPKKIIGIRLIKSRTISNRQIKTQEKKIQEAMQFMVQQSSSLTAGQKKAQIDQINKANEQLFDRTLLKPKQYEKQLNKYFSAINKIANQETEDIKRFVARA